jgi:hypothetical protein
MTPAPITATRPISGLVADDGRQLDFNRNPTWQGCNADRDAGMRPSIREKLSEQFRSAIDDRAVALESSICRDIARQPYEALDLVEAPRSSLQLGKRIEERPTRTFSPLFDGD